MMTKKIDFKHVFKTLRERVGKSPLPSVSELANGHHDPFRVLISTMISLRTKDEVTLKVSQRLFKKADNPDALSRLDEETIAELIYPAGFYRNKAVNIKKTAAIIRDDYGAEVPKDIDSLLELPGVGRKTANLVLSIGFGIPAICVDTHVHRISNRLGWVKTKTPEETEQNLEKIVPKEYWIPINELFVSYGKEVCTPRSPFCSTCPVEDICPQVGVERRR